MNGLNMVIIKICPQALFRLSGPFVTISGDFGNDQIMAVLKEDTIFFKFLGFDFSRNNLNHIPSLFTWQDAIHTRFLFTKPSRLSRSCFALFLDYG